MNTWCPLPWIGLGVKNNGNVRVCCNANASKNRGFIKKNNGSIYNLKQDSIQDSRNGQLLKDIRLSILNNKFHPSCIRCQQETETGLKSRAEAESSIWEHIIDFEKAKLITNDDGSIDINKVPIKYLDFRFGNKCNLKCRMCGPTDSDQWYDDIAAVWGPRYIDGDERITLICKNGHYIPENITYDWYENPNFWNDIENEINSIEQIYIVGGEPLLIQQQYDFLQKCIDLDRAKYINIEYNTNLTIVPDKVWDLWKEFRTILLGISIDAIGPLNDYIRYPSNWKTIENNLRILDNAQGNFKIRITPTITVYNLVHLPDLMLWKIKQNFNIINRKTINVILNPHPLHNPKFLNIKTFPLESKQWIINYFNEQKVKAKNEIFALDILTIEEKQLSIKYYNDILDNYIKFMMSEDYSDKLEKFWKYNNKLDIIRKQSLKDISNITWCLLLGEQYQ